MSVMLMAAVWPLDLPTTDKMVLLALADAANDDGVTWIAVRSKKEQKLDILKKCSLSERAVQGAIKRLKDAGHIERDEVAGKGCIYRVHPVSTPAADAPRSECAPQETTHTPAADAGKPLITINTPQKATPSSGARKGTRVPADFWPKVGAESATAQAMAQWPPGEVAEQVEHFIDHHTAKGTTSLDWQASWRTWVKLGKRYNGKRPANDHRLEHQNPLFRAAFGTSGFGFAD